MIGTALMRLLLVQRAEKIKLLLMGLDCAQSGSIHLLLDPGRKHEFRQCLS